MLIERRARLAVSTARKPGRSSTVARTRQSVMPTACPRFITRRLPGVIRLLPCVYSQNASGDTGHGRGDFETVAHHDGSGTHQARQAVDLGGVERRKLTRDREHQPAPAE